MPIIKINKNEIFEISLRKFKKSCEKAGILYELKKREFYEKPSTKRKKINNFKNKLFKLKNKKINNKWF